MNPAKPVKISVRSRTDGTHVFITTSSGKRVHRVFDGMGEALASIQTKENHRVPTKVNGQPTIITCWARG
jgi:hypothetical protein